MERAPTHDDLVKLAAKWLQTRHSLVITEMASGGMETPDAIGFTGVYSTLVECKASRADFVSDRKKWFRRDPSRGMGDFRYFLVPYGLIDRREIPDDWGLLVVRNEKVRRYVKAAQQPKAARRETSLLLSVIRRIGAGWPEGVSVKCYEYTTKNRATVGLVKETIVHDDFTTATNPDGEV